MARTPKGTAVTPPETQHLFTVLGNSLGLKIEDLADSVKQIQGGLGFDKLTEFQRTSLLPMESIARVMQIPKRTMVRRRKSRKLSPGESERLVRLSLIFEKATNLFEGDKAAARTWLNAPCKALGHIAPLVVAETELGARAVEDVIGQMEHGVFA
jgi:putative toxin-antitoxin system antitoxin component (TIGR02293 family)